MTPSSERLREIRKEVVAILDTHRDPDQRIDNTHARAALRPHLVIDGVGDGDRERAVVAKIGRQHDALQTVQEVEAIEPWIELER